MVSLKQRATGYRLFRRYVETLLPSRRDREILAGVSTCCMFIGHGRSGSTLIGSLLDAHPNVIIAHELDALKHIQAGFSRRQLYTLLLENSRRYSEGGRKAGGYRYLVENQWQGRFDRLQVIGDKKASSVSNRLSKRPDLLTKFARVTGDKVRLIHVVRNPYDNITSRARRREETLSDKIGPYFEKCQTVLDTRQAIEAESTLDIRMVSVRHEDYVAAPRDQLRKLCEFLELDTTPDYLNACAAIVHESTSKARFHAGWTPALIARVAEAMQRFPFLHGYSYDA